MHTMVKGNHFQLKGHPLLFHKYKWFNIKAFVGHQPAVQKEVNEPLSKGAITASMGGVKFYP